MARTFQIDGTKGQESRGYKGLGKEQRMLVWLEQSEQGGEHEMRMKTQNGGAAGDTLLGLAGPTNEFAFQQTLDNI